MRLTLGKDLMNSYIQSENGPIIWSFDLPLSVFNRGFNRGRIFQFFPPLLILTYVCVCVCVLKERGNYTGYRQSGAANWRTKRGNRVSTVDISAAMFSFGLINSRIRPQFARLGLLIFVQLIIKSAP